MSRAFEAFRIGLGAAVTGCALVAARLLALVSSSRDQRFRVFGVLSYIVGATVHALAIVRGLYDDHVDLLAGSVLFAALGLIGVLFVYTRVRAQLEAKSEDWR